MMPTAEEMYIDIYKVCEEDAINVRAEKLDETLPSWMIRDGDTLNISDKD